MCVYIYIHTNALAVAIKRRGRHAPVRNTRSFEHLMFKHEEKILMNLYICIYVYMSMHMHIYVYVYMHQYTGSGNQAARQARSCAKLKKL